MSRASALAQAKAAWGDAAPDWIVALATACDRSSQAQVARRLGRSSAMICNSLRAKYPGDMRALEQLVRGVFMAATVTCPVLGEVSAAACAQIQRSGFSTASPAAAQLYRACRSGCVHGLRGGDNDD